MGLLDSWLMPARERRSLENPSTSLSDPDDWLYEAFGAAESATGERISAETALRFSPWWRGISLVSRSVGKLPLVVMKRIGKGKEKDTLHQAYRLLRYRANDELMSASTFKQTIQSLAMSRGNGYAWIRRNQHAEPLELIVICPGDCWPFRENGRLWYAVKVESEWIRESPVNVFHIRGLSRDGLVGYPVYKNASDSLGEGIAAQHYEARFFKNDARPSVIIEVPGNMPPEAQKEFLRQWENMHAGVNNSHRTAILTNGGKVNPFSSSAKDSELSEMRKFNLVDIANWIGVPVHKIGGEGRTAYASLEQENQGYLDDSLDPWLVTWEDEAREKLLTEEQKDRDTHIVEFMRQAILRADMAARYTAYNTAVRGGWINRDEVRGIENLNPMPDGEGEKFFAPLELQVVGDDEPPEVTDLPTVLTVTEAVVAGQIPPDTAKAMLKLSFPLLTDQHVNDIIDPLEEFEPPKPETAGPPMPPAQPDASVAIPDDQSTTEGDGQSRPSEPRSAPAIPPWTVQQLAEAVAQMMDQKAVARDDERLRKARLAIVQNAVGRSLRLLKIRNEKRARDARNFLKALDDYRLDDLSQLSEIMAPASELFNHDNAIVCSYIWDTVKGQLLEATGMVRSQDHAELELHVRNMLTELESTLLTQVTDFFMKGPSNGTTLSA